MTFLMGILNKSLFKKCQKKSRLLIYLETHFNIHNFNESYEQYIRAEPSSMR